MYNLSGKSDKANLKAKNFASRLLACEYAVIYAAVSKRSHEFLSNRISPHLGDGFTVSSSSTSRSFLSKKNCFSVGDTYHGTAK